MGWENAKELTKKAENWENFIKNDCPAETMDAQLNSIIYTPDFRENTTKIRVVQDTSQNAIFKIKTEGKMAVLNFASYKKPGGGYINGAMAQEEALCHCSNLYQVLSYDKLQKEFYEYNNEHLNKGLYDSRIIYSPDIVFYRDNTDLDNINKDIDTRKCNVITCAAPNKNAAQNYQHIPDYAINHIMKDRILSILNVAKHQHIEILILGAFGCGVFGNDITITAKIFKECLTKYQYYRNIFTVVAFAIPDDTTYNIFKDILGNL
ncbi:MAG: TIGR02452 family protein [Bacilli bacterium]|nr:TIGR02452 family protein [Bacilli bacterium]